MCTVCRSYDEIATFDSALDALNKDLDMKSILNNAQSFQHKKILPFRKVRICATVCDCHVIVM